MTRRLAMSLLGCALLSAAVGEAVPRRGPDGEAKLAKALAGRTAGKPVDCIYLPRVRSSRIIDRTAIVYDAGGTVYVNRPRNGANTLDDDDIMVTRTSISQLCSVDIVRLIDRASRIEHGFVSLGQFVPYTRTRQR